MSDNCTSTSNTEEPFCRLCAEPTPTEQLITPDEDVAISSKIAIKLLWINIDISTNKTLPSTICFSCFDLLERTYTFLHNVRSAQEKLWGIFGKNAGQKKDEVSNDVKSESLENAGKPVDEDWQQFEKTKFEVKLDPDEKFSAMDIVDTSSLLKLVSINEIKLENVSDNDLPRHGSDFNTTDSDVPLKRSVKKKKKAKKKKKVKFDPEISVEDLLNKTENDALPLDISTLNYTWEDYMCRCAQCDALCKNIASLRLHAIEIHTHCCTFKCSDCRKVLSNFKSFVNHVRTHQNSLRYCCEYCNERFTMVAYVKTHLITEHKNSALFTCQNCGAYFETEESLQDHLIMYSKVVKRGRRSEVTYNTKCEICGKEFKSRSNLQQHKLVHMERRRDFACHVCGKMFFTKGTLSTHMSTHEETKPFKCEFCPLTFRARGNLTSHMSLHSGAKPFVCEQCGKSFRVKRHLKSHSIVHTDLMPYVCEYCNKRFRFKTRLNLHIRQHTGAKPYTCCYCQRDFTNGSNYKKHMKRRHNIDTSKRQKYENNVNVDQNFENSQDGTESV